jgi:3-oxoacyl-[acyl-carrier-protein] synthase II
VSHPHAVWITGVGTATSLGHAFEPLADQLLAGTSGIDRVTGFDVADHPSQVAAQLRAIPCPPSIEPGEFAALPRLEQVVLWCCESALRDSGWWDRRHDVRVGLALGMGAELLMLFEADALVGGDLITQPGYDRPVLIERVRSRFGLTGPAAVVSAACASGNYALSQARDWLRLGWADICVAGACDAAVTPMSLAGFGNLRALSRRNAAPRTASRPFDRERDGFVMGEGGAVFVLESASSARPRSAPAYAEVAGFGASSDAHNMVIPSPDPEPAIAAVRQALADAGVAPAEIDYINAHATSTPVGDIAETRVLGTVLGEAVHHVPVSSTKSMTGHLLTAAAAVEALACIVAMSRGALPPTINLDDPDPECNLLHVANEARPGKVRVAVSNSFGFGGSNTCLVLKAV